MAQAFRSKWPTGSDEWPTPDGGGTSGGVSVRSILIPTLGVSAVNVDLTAQDKDNLYQSGVQSATAFLSTWDLQKYLAVYRSGAPVPTRRDLMS